ncbi:MAG: PD40 domain-containing protein [Flavobacteriales bacterium]|nr:PD40 domain-containing protein [Flavobacteriales bacterium]
MEYKRSKSQVFKYTVNQLFLFCFALLLLSCSTQQINAQTYTSTSKKAIKLYTEAQGAYQKYSLDAAKNLLLQSLEKDPSFVEAKTLLAYIQLDQRLYPEAKKSFEEAIQINPTAVPNNFYFLAELELQDGEYEKAKKLLTQFTTTRGIEQSMMNKANKSLDIVDFSLKAKANPIKFEPKNLGKNINTAKSEYFPSLTVDENTLLFTRRLESPNSPQGFNEDFYVSYKQDGEWQPAQNIQKPINTEFNEGAPTLSADGQLLIFTACELYGDYGSNRRGSGSCDLFYSAKNGKNWTNPINLGKTINTKNWETQPSFSADGKTLYFVRGIRDRSGQRTGDIYVSQLGSDSYWTKPVPLNPNINTRENEESVFIHPDGKTLYFSSNGHTGMGGLDIFMSKKDENGEWGKPVNLGYPINSHKNENSLLVSANGQTAFFASDRDEGFGELDLYSFELPEQFAPNPVSYFAGKIFDKKNKKPLGAKFELIDLTTKEIVVESFSDKISGQFLVSLPVGRDYALNASKNGYLFYSENFSLTNRKDNTPFTQDVPLQAIEVGEKIILKNVFFETAKYDLKEKSKVELNKLIAFLKKERSTKDRS